MTSEETSTEETRHVVQTKNATIIQRVLFVARMLEYPVELSRSLPGVTFVTPTPLPQSELAALLWFLFYPSSEELHDIARIPPTMEHIVQWHATWLCGRSLSTQIDHLSLPVSRSRHTRKHLRMFLEAETEERAAWIGRHFARDLLRSDIAQMWQGLEGKNDDDRAHLQTRETLWFSLMVEHVTRQVQRRKSFVMMDGADRAIYELPTEVPAASDS